VRSGEKRQPKQASREGRRGGETANEVLALAITQAVQPIASVCPHLPDAICQVIDKALAYNKKDRFGSASEMQAAVRSAYREISGVQSPSLGVAARFLFLWVAAYTEAMPPTPSSALSVHLPLRTVPTRASARSHCLRSRAFDSASGSRDLLLGCSAATMAQSIP
jgi:hypothetical protein